MVLKKIGIAALFYSLWACSVSSCGAGDELSIMLVFDQQTDVDIIQSVWIAALIPKDIQSMSCTPFLNEEKDAHSAADVELVSEVTASPSSLSENKIVLTSVGEGERLFYAETRMQGDVVYDSGCTVAVAGQVDQDGKQEIIIRLGGGD